MGVRDMGDWDMGDQDMGARDMGDWDISNWDIGLRGMHGWGGCPSPLRPMAIDQKSLGHGPKRWA